jgi:hypothetical protein
VNFIFNTISPECKVINKHNHLWAGLAENNEKISYCKKEIPAFPGRSPGIFS